MEILREPPVRWGMVVGDVAQNLRAALDHAVWQLAVRRLGREPEGLESRHVQFPVTKTERAFKEAPVLKMLSPEAVGALKRLQPWRPREGAEFTPIATLNWLARVDRHSVLRGSYVALDDADYASMRLRANSDAGSLLDYRCLLFADDSFADGSDVARMRYEMRGPHPEVRIEGQFPAYVAFGDAEYAIRLSTLRKMHGSVVSALKVLEPLFELPR